MMDNTPFARTLGPHDGMEIGHEYILVVVPVDGHLGYKWYAFDHDSIVVCNGEADCPVDAFTNAKAAIQKYDHNKCHNEFRSFMGRLWTDKEKTND